MSETQPTAPFDKCLNCPNLGRIARLFARAGGLEELAPDCEGPVKVHRGVVETRLRYPGDPKIDKKEFDYSRVVGPAYGWNSDRPTRYSKTTWTRETACGRDADSIQPNEGEVPYDPYRERISTNPDSSRHAAFIGGDEEELADVRSVQGVMSMLDAVSEMQIAAKQGHLDGMQAAHDKIEEQGFSLLAVAGRDDGDSIA
ncbi:MAG TPA: hypothetical protein VMT96_00440 [Candidatus Bathyarchaeia archaeon]|nr:hypothetical protein [Candidatus Bathyarchaeia archaeon]